MRFGYALSRLLGSVYGNGNVVFLPPEGTCILSPVRNRVVSWRCCTQRVDSPHTVVGTACERYSTDLMLGQHTVIVTPTRQGTVTRVVVDLLL